MSKVLDTILGGSSLGSGSGGVFKIQSTFGYVVLAGVGSVFLTTWQAIQVGKIRKRDKIYYPTMYSADNDLFNWYQRTHQTTLENYPQFLAMLVLGGLEMPVLCTAAGVMWITGRIPLSFCYYIGEPMKRLRTAFGHISSLMMLGASLKFAYRLIRSS